MLTVAQVFDEAESLGQLISIVLPHVRDVSGDELLRALMYAGQALVGQQFANAYRRKDLTKDIEYRLYINLADDTALLEAFHYVRQLSLPKIQAKELLYHNLAHLNSLWKVSERENVERQTTRLRHFGREAWKADAKNMRQCFSYELF
jgi:hypothetical protein